MKIKKSILIFTVSFFYIYFLTQNIPIFFEGREFLIKLVQKPLNYWLKEIFYFGATNPLNSVGEADGFLAILLQYFFGYNENIYRIIKAIFFAGTSTLIFKLAKLLMKEKFALIATTIITLSFPYFLQNIIYDEPFIYSEFFKIAALILLFKDLKNSSLKNNIGILSFTFISFRLYHIAISILGILGLIFLISKKIRYLCIIIILFFFIFPRSLSETHLTSPAYFPKLTIINEFFILGFKKTFRTFPTLLGLYHRPFWDIITPAGILLISFIIIFIIYYRIKWKFPAKVLSIWALTEFPLFIFIPESAIRYSAGILTPLVLLTFYFFDQAHQRMKKNYQKPTLVIVCILISIIILTNIAYTITFRTTWGSGFITAGKTIDYLQQKNKELIIGYEPMQVAPDFVPIDTTTRPYAIDKKLQFVSYIKPIKQDYIVQRITSSGKKYPENLNGTIETEIIGTTNNLFDTLFKPLRKFVPENKIIIYKT